MFLRKACRGILATKFNIVKRLKKGSSECPRCQHSAETDCHIFLECPEAKEVWRKMSHLHVPNGRNFRSFKDWFGVVLNEQKVREVEIIVVIIWLLWKSRNESIFEGMAREAANICAYGQTLLMSYQEQHGKRVASISYQNPRSSDSKWKPPHQDFLKINVDASYIDGVAGIGVVVRDHIGELQAVYVEAVPFCFDAKQAETVAFLKALEFAKEMEITHLVLEGDALGVVKKISNQNADLSRTASKELKI